MSWSNILGWFGFCIVLFSYAQVATCRWRVRSVMNQVGNVVGPSSLGINSFVYGAWVPVTLNFIWVSIAIYTLVQILWDTKKS